jgi:flagellar protein FliS
MTQRDNPWQSYRKVTTQTATSEHLVLMLYDGAIKFLKQGLAGFRFTDPRECNETINNNILRAQDIIHELNARLNMEEGGEIADNFRRLYNYFYSRLTEANLKKKKPPIEEVIGHLCVLRDAWEEMLRRDRGDATTSPEISRKFA